MDSTQLLKGTLDAAVLAVLENEDGYGYDIVRRLRDAGFNEIGEASVYGTLRRMFVSGALSTYVVASVDGPHRKYYSLKPEGRAILNEQRKTWRKFAEVMNNLLGATKKASK